MKFLKNQCRLFILPGLFSCLWLTPDHWSRAAQIQGVTISAVSAQYTSLNTSNPDRRYATNLVTSTGLFGDIGTVAPQGSEWLDTAAPPGTNFVTFDLGAVHEVDAIKVWNFNQNGSAANLNNCVKYACISYSLDGVNFTTNYANGQYFLQAPGTFSAFAQTIATNMGFSARYVRFNIASNYTATGITGTVGLSKVRFVDNTVPPTLLSASENYGSNQVTLAYSESIDPATATNKLNYAIQTSGTNSAAILSVTLGEFNDRVILQTSPLTNGSYTVTASGVYDQALTAPLAVTNLPVQPELILWLKADAGVLTDGAGTVTQWNDQTIYGHNALTNLAVNQYFAPPTLSPGTLNGLPVVSFNGTQLMNIPDDSNLEINGDLTVCLVLSSASSQLGDPISKTGGQGIAYTGTPLHGYTNNMPGPFDIQIAKTTGKPNITWGGPENGTGLGTFSASFGLINQYYVVTFVVNGTNCTCYVNGSFNGSSAPFNMGVRDAKNPIMLGVRSDSGNVGDGGAQFLGNLAEVMLVRGTMKPSDLNAMHNYLGNKYGIPIVSLAINEQPQNVTAQVGKTATFWVNAVGVPPMTYQWQTNTPASTYANIGGATSASYTTPPLSSVPYNGLNYRVVVTSAVGVTNSTPATLTVVNDTTPPALYSAVKLAGNTNLLVTFSEAVDPTTALNPANYSLNNGASVMAASFGSTVSNGVVLATSPLDPNAAYNLSVQAVQDLFGNSLSSAASPVLPAGLSLYLRGDSGVVVDGSGLVEQWRDQTANANHAVQYLGGPGARPLTGDTMNGVPVLQFSGANTNFMLVASSPGLALTNDMSVYAVVDFFDQSLPHELLSKTGSGTSANLPAPYDYYVWGSRNQTDFLRGNGSVFGSATGTLPAAGTPHVLSVTMGGTNVSLFRDGAPDATGVINTNISDVGTPLYVGARSDFAQWMNGDMAEIMVFNSALSPADRTNVDNYLGAKYFPFNLAQAPASVTTNQGVAVSFSVVASQGSAHLAYQWRENGTNIPGATQAGYTTPILSPADNGDTFDVVMTVPGFSTNISSVAMLTVNNAAPTILSAGEPIWSQTNIVVLFSEVIDPVTATVAGNYALNNGASVLSAVMGDAANKVVLTTTALIPGTAYTLNAQNVKDPYGNTITPVAVPNGIYPPATALWIKADTGVTTDSGGVNQWNDQSGNGNNLVQGFGPPFEPQLAANPFNGEPVVRFAATNLTYLSAADAPSLEISGDMSIFAVMNFATLAGNTNGMIVSKTSLSLPAPYDYYVRPAQVQLYRGNGSTYGFANSTNVPSTGVPHLLDVVMQGNTVSHRLDAGPGGVGSISTPIADTAQPLYIGARSDAFDRLTGDMAELIVIGSAVSSNDLASLENYLITKHRLPTGLQSYPVITREPVAATNASQNATLTVPAAAAGNPQVAFQWYHTNNLPVTGQTNSTLVISNVAVSDSYYLVVSNVFGAVSSTPVAVNVISGLPQILADVQAPFFVMPGGTVANAASVYGTLPLTFQWLFNTTNLVDNGRISGSQGSRLAIANAQPGDAGNYQLVVTNNFGAVTSSVAALIVGSLPVGFNTSGLGWTADQSGPFSTTAVANGLLTLTDGGANESRSFFFQYPQYIGGFKAAFTYQAGGNVAADGVTFCLQNDPRGVSALGGAGGQLGVGSPTPITPSVELELNLYNGGNETRGYTILTNGLTGAGGANGNYQPPGALNLNSGDPVNITVYYANSQMTLTFTDAVASASYSASLNVGNLTQILGGNTAYVGFTGGAGTSTSIQTITDFSFVSIPPVNLQLTGGGTAALVTWPGTAAGYVLQRNLDLTTTNWVTVTGVDLLTNGINAVTIPTGATNQFYRLVLPTP